MSSTTLLIDGDTLAFIASSACQMTLEEDGFYSHFGFQAEGEKIVDNQIHKLKEQLGAEDIKVYLSCPAEENWRLKVDPNYKSNRKSSIRPILLSPLKQYLRQKYGAEHMAYLEADDTLGVVATHPDLVPGEKIIVGRDKDFATIPGLHYQLKDDDEDGNPIVRTVTPMEAMKSHFVQTLSGDAVDGYPGCPGVGKTTAERIVENPEKLVAKKGVITRGKNKGQETVKWYSAGPSTIWEAIVSRYQKAGLGEEDALRTGRLAKILLADDYDIETSTVYLWEPNRAE
jgi:DNA polymerase-1